MHRAQGVGAQRHRASSTVPAQTSTHTRPRRPSPSRSSTRARPPRQGDLHQTRVRRRRLRCPQRVERRQRLGPAGAPELWRHGRPGHRGPLRRRSPGSTPRPGHERRQGSGASAAAEADDAGAVGAQADGQRRALRTPAHHVLAAPEHPHGLAAFRRPGPGHERAPGCGACRRRHRRWPAATRDPAGAAPAGIGLDVGRLDPGRLQGQGPLARPVRRRDATGARCCCGPAPARSPARPARKPGAVGASAPSWTRAPAGRRSSAKPARPRTTSGPESWKSGPSIWARQAARSGIARHVDGRRAPSWSDVERPAAASTMDCHPVQRQRWARSAASTSRRDGGAPGACSSAARRMTMPGVQKPHWLAPWRRRRRPSGLAARRRQSLERGDLPPGDAAHRGDAGDTGRVVDPDGAAATLTLRATAVLDGAAAEFLAQRVEEEMPSATATSRR